MQKFYGPTGLSIVAYTPRVFQSSRGFNLSITVTVHSEGFCVVLFWFALHNPPSCCEPLLSLTNRVTVCYFGRAFYYRLSPPQALLVLVSYLYFARLSYGFTSELFSAADTCLFRSYKVIFLLCTHRRVYPIFAKALNPPPTSKDMRASRCFACVAFFGLSSVNPSSSGVIFEPYH